MMMEHLRSKIEIGRNGNGGKIIGETVVNKRQ